MDSNKPPTIRYLASRVMAVCIALAYASPCATYFVSQSGGNDGNSGSRSAPWKSLSKALGLAKAGDSVYVHPGTYVDGSSTPFRAFNPENSGTASAKIVFKSLEKHKAVIGTSSDNHPAWGLNDRSHIVIDGFKIVGAIGLRDRSDFGIIRNCDVTRGFVQQGDKSLHWAIYVSGSSDCIVENNRVHSLAPLGNKWKNATGIEVIGVPGSADRNLIQHNDVDASFLVYSAYGQKAGKTKDNIYRRNIARNATAGFYGMGATNNDNFSVSNRYYENLIFDCKNAFETDHLCDGFLIWNNTAVNAANFLHGGDRKDGYAQNIRMQVWNNILSSTSTSSAFYRRDADPVSWKLFLSYSDNNGMHCGKAAGWAWAKYSNSLAQWSSATAFDRASLIAIPQFRDPSKGDYRLKAGSPYIGKGQNRNGLSPGQGGKVPDIGAWPRGDDGTRIGLVDAQILQPDQPNQPQKNLSKPRNLPADNYAPVKD